MGPSLRLMVAPEPVTPYSAQRRTRYGFVVRGWPTHLVAGAALSDHGRPHPQDVERGDVDGHLQRPGQQFSSWSRFPFAEVSTANDSVVVRFDDVRYARLGQRSFASVTIVLGHQAR